MLIPSQNLIFLGNSGSGKSTACEYLEKRFDYKNIHPLAFYKHFLEDHYGLNRGDLDSQITRNTIPTGASVSLGQTLVDSFDFWKGRDPYFTTRKLIRDLGNYWKNGDRVCLQAIRNVPEAMGIIETAQQLNEKFIVVYLTGRGEEKISDRYLKDIDVMLSISGQCSKRVEYDNSENDESAFYTFLYQTLK